MLWGQIHQAWFVPLLVGITLLIAVLYYRQQARQLSQTIGQLYQLNGTVKQDTLDFIQQAWPLMQKAGFNGVDIKGQWFGEAYQKKEGGGGRRIEKLQFEVNQEDIQLRVTLTFPSRGAEAKLKLKVIAETYKQILQSNVTLKQMQLLAAQNQLQRYQLYVQHDLKNLVQGIGLLRQQLESLSESHSQRYLQHLRLVLPKLDQQAQSLLKPIKVETTFSSQSIQLKPLIEAEIQKLKLPYQFEGDEDIQLHLPASALRQVFQNVLGNYIDHPGAHQPLLKIQIHTSEHQVEIQFKTPKSPVLHTEICFDSLRMFEPFWSSSESGMGLGLFLAREVLKKIGGNITFWEKPRAYGFTIYLPIFQN